MSDLENHYRERLEAIEEFAKSEDVVANKSLYKAHFVALDSLRTIIDLYNKIRNYSEQVEIATDLLVSETDRELINYLNEEIDAFKYNINTTNDRLKDILIDNKELLYFPEIILIDDTNDQRYSYRWEPIRDLENTEAFSLENDQLRYLEQIWAEKFDALSDEESIKIFIQKLKRQWAVETGLIERIYTLDRGLTTLLIEQGIDASIIPHGKTNIPPEKLVRVIRDHYDVVDGLFDFVKGNRLLTVGYIKEIHAQLTKNQLYTEAVDQFGKMFEVEFVHGDYKKYNNNPTREDGSIHEYCPPQHVSSEMDRMIELHNRHLSDNYPPEVEAAWLHHVFTQIHPFQDGNGRVARALSSLIFIKHNWPPLVIKNDDRVEYIRALENADLGNYEKLVVFVSRIAENTLKQVITISEETKLETGLKEIMGVVNKKLRKKTDEIKKEWKIATDTSEKLYEITKHKLETISTFVYKTIDRQNIKGNAQISVYVSSNSVNEDRIYYNRNQIIKCARELGYYANISGFHMWLQLNIVVEAKSEIFLSFHQIGKEYNGLIAVSMSLSIRDKIEDGGYETANAVLVSDEYFTINYKEDYSNTERRYKIWLDRNIEKAIAMWAELL